MTFKTVMEKYEKGTFEQVRDRLIYFVRLLYKSKTCSSQITVLTPCLTPSCSSSICISHMCLLLLPTFLLPVLPWRPQSGEVGSFAVGRGSRHRVRRAAPGRGAGDWVCLGCCSLPGIQQLQAPCQWTINPLQGLCLKDKSCMLLGRCQFEHPCSVSSHKLKPDGVVFI